MASTSNTPSNSAAYMVSKEQRSPLQVKSAPYTRPGPNEVVVQNRAVAINPVDHIIQKLGTGLMYQWLKFPAVLGYDVSGTVVEVGSQVSRFAPGDRVVGFAKGLEKAANKSSEGAFQNYVVLGESMTAKIPQSMSYVEASVIPLGLATASCGLYFKDKLGLDLPSPTRGKKNGKTVLIWSGASSVGSNAIQLAVASGYEVITTASPKNWDYVKSLGASQVFDYRSKTLSRDVASAISNTNFAGALAIGNGSTESIFNVLSQTRGSNIKKNVAMASFSMPEDAGTLGMVFAFVSSGIRNWITCKRYGIKAGMIWGGDLAFKPEGEKIMREFLQPALENGTFLARPEPQIVGQGLEKVQEAMEIQKKGVSAKKVVISL